MSICTFCTVIVAMGVLDPPVDPEGAALMCVLLAVFCVVSPSCCWSGEST